MNSRVVEDPEATKVTMTTMFYSVEWLRRVGYFRASETGGGDLAIAPLGHTRSEPGKAVDAKTDSDLFQISDLYKGLADPKPSHQIFFPSFLAGLVLGVGCTVSAVIVKNLIFRKKRRAGYAPIAA